MLSMHDIFEFTTTGITPEGDAQGYFCATGLRPNLLSNLVESGVNLPDRNGLNAASSQANKLDDTATQNPKPCIP